MKKCRKAIGICLVMILLVISISGCKSSKDTKTSQSSEPTQGTTQKAEKREIVFPLKDSPEISMFAASFGNGWTFGNTRAWEYLQEKMNVNWKIQEEEAASLAEKRGLLLATGQYPDVFYKAGLSQVEVDEQASLGVFIPLDDLIKDYAPHLNKILEERPEVKEILQSQDGHIYSLPQLVSQDPQIQNAWINSEWLERLNLKKPTNKEELYDVLKAFKEQDANGNGDPNDEIPFSTYVDIPFMNMMPFFKTTVNTQTNTTIEDDVIKYVPASENYKEMIAYVKKLYEDKLLDPNVFSQTKEQLKAKALESDICGSLLMGAVGRVVDQDGILRFDAIDPFEGGGVYTGSGVYPGTLCITDKCKNPEIVMAWADFFYSPEGSELTWIGINGETYEIDSEGKYKSLLSEEEKTQVKGHLQGGASLPCIRDEELRMKQLEVISPGGAHFQRERDRYVAEFGIGIYPKLYFSEKQTSDIARIAAVLNPYVTEYFAKVVVGEYDLDSTWDDYLKNLKNMELDKLLNIYQEAYNAR